MGWDGLGSKTNFFKTLIAGPHSIKTFEASKYENNLIFNFNF